MKVSIIDIIIYIALGIFLIFGFFKGFKMKRIRLFLFAFSLVGAFLLGIPLARGIMNTNVGNGWLLNLFSKNIPDSEIMLTKIDASDFNSMRDLLSSGLKELKVPIIFHGLFTNQAIILSMDVKSALASSFAFLSLCAFFVLIIFLILCLSLYFIFKPIWQTVFGENGKGIFGRFAGMLAGIVKVSFLIIGVLSIINVIDTICLKSGFTKMDDWLVSDLYLNQPEKFSIGKLYFNMTSWLIDWIKTL